MLLFLLHLTFVQNWRHPRQPEYAKVHAPTKPLPLAMSESGNEALVNCTGIVTGRCGIADQTMSARRKHPRPASTAADQHGITCLDVPLAVAHVPFSGMGPQQPRSPRQRTASGTGISLGRLSSISTSSTSIDETQEDRVARLNSLYSGKLLPVEDSNNAFVPPMAVSRVFPMCTVVRRFSL